MHFSWSLSRISTKSRNKVVAILTIFINVNTKIKKNAKRLYIHVESRTTMNTQFII